jgi:hypothetical protein
MRGWAPTSSKLFADETKAPVLADHEGAGCRFIDAMGEYIFALVK